MELLVASIMRGSHRSIALSSAELSSPAYSREKNSSTNPPRGKRPPSSNLAAICSTSESNDEREKADYERRDDSVTVVVLTMTAVKVTTRIVSSFGRSRDVRE